MEALKRVVETQMPGPQPIPKAQSGPRKAILVARVSSKPQEENGFSLPAQDNFLTAYAAQIDATIVKKFSFAESAKKEGRKHFEEVLKYLRDHRDVKIALFEKTDRLSRNLQDYVKVEELVEELDIEIHLVKEGQVLRKTARSQDRLVAGIFALLARNYIQNMQEEIIKGQIVKAERGYSPGRAMFGYMHDRETRTHVEHPTKGKVVRLMFQLYVTGEYSVESLREAIFTRTGAKISKGHLHKMLQSRFYIGQFVWRRVEYKGKHPHLVDHKTFARAQELISGRNGSRSKSRKHSFAFTQLVHCSKDGCLLTAELAKGKYPYYHCSFGKGRHKVPWLPETKLSEMLGNAVTQIRIPTQVATGILAALEADQSKLVSQRQEEFDSASKRLKEIELSKLEAYGDFKRGVIDEALWSSLRDGWSVEELRLRATVETYSSKPLASEIESVRKTFELVQFAHSKWDTLLNTERAKIAKIVLSNCSSDGVTLSFQYRKPFDLVVERGKNEEWRLRRDSNSRRTARQAGVLSLDDVAALGARFERANSAS